MPFCLYFSGKMMKFRKGFHIQQWAAFISTWLGSYCVIVGPGAFVRPKVFIAAFSIAQDSAFYQTIVVHLYNGIEDVLCSIIDDVAALSLT